LKKNIKDRTVSAKGKSRELATVGTRSVRELKGLFQDKRRKSVSIEKMQAAIIRGALKGNT